MSRHFWLYSCDNPFLAFWKIPTKGETKMLILHRVHKAKKGPRRGQETMVECIIKDGQSICGGLALCDPRDRFDLKTGMDLSFQRAMHGIKNRTDKNRTLGINTNGAIKNIQDCGFPILPSKVCTLKDKAALNKACRLEQKLLSI